MKTHLAGLLYLGHCTVCDCTVFIDYEDSVEKHEKDKAVREELEVAKRPFTAVAERGLPAWKFWSAFVGGLVFYGATAGSAAAVLWRMMG